MSRTMDRFKMKLSGEGYMAAIAFEIARIIPQSHPAVSPGLEQRISKGPRFLFHVSSEWGVVQGLSSPSR
ncbi:hypothetical protein LguiA_030219 [Lonicera macranthoides]